MESEWKRWENEWTEEWKEFFTRACRKDMCDNYAL